MMNKKQLALVADLILQKMEQLNDRTQTGVPERIALKDYARDLKEILNEDIIIWYAENILAGILRGTIIRINNEFSKVEPDQGRIRRELDVVMNFLHDTVGVDEYEYTKLSPKEVKEDFDRLEEDMKEIAEMFPKAVFADEVPDEIKDKLNELKKQFEKMQKENEKCRN